MTGGKIVIWISTFKLDTILLGSIETFYSG